MKSSFGYLVPLALLAVGGAAYAATRDEEGENGELDGPPGTLPPLPEPPSLPPITAALVEEGLEILTPRGAILDIGTLGAVRKAAELLEPWRTRATAAGSPVERDLAIDAALAAVERDQPEIADLEIKRAARIVFGEPDAPVAAEKVLEALAIRWTALDRMREAAARRAADSDAPSRETLRDSELGPYIETAEEALESVPIVGPLAAWFLGSVADNPNLRPVNRTFWRTAEEREQGLPDLYG